MGWKHFHVGKELLTFYVFLSQKATKGCSTKTKIINQEKDNHMYATQKRDTNQEGKVNSQYTFEEKF